MASAGAKTGVSVKQVIEDLITRCQTNQGTDQDHERMGRIYVVAINLRNAYNTFGRDSEQSKNIEDMLREVFIEIGSDLKDGTGKVPKEELEASVQDLGDLLGKLNIGQ